MTNALQYLIDGTDVESYAQILTAMSGDLTIVGDDDVIPYRTGAVFRRRTPGPGDLQLSLDVNGDDGAGGESVEQYLANWNGLRVLCWDLNTPKTLTRRRRLPDSSIIEMASQATLVQLPQENKNGPSACHTVLDFRLLDGHFYGTSDVTITSPGTVTVQGEARTSRMVVTMSAGTLTNTTTGAVLTYSGTGTASIDVDAWTAVSGTTDVAAHVSWPPVGHDYWFDLDPGVNVLTGTASIAYRPAYLP